MQEVFALVRSANGVPLSAEVVARHLGLAPDVARHMLMMLVQRGRLVQVEGACAGCEVCPLHRFCAGASQVGVDRQPGPGYRIRVP